MTKVVILIGGPSKGTRFRPLSLERAKPLFPVAGHPLIWHHLKACTKVPNLQEVLLMGFYTLDKDWNDFIEQAQKEFGFKIRYLHEDARLGTMGGINKFRDEILQGNTEGLFFVLHCDIVCSFPLLELLQTHASHGKECTILGHKVASEEAHKYGCLAVNESTNEVLHYAEKPETFVSDIINCGVYLFSSSIFTLIDNLPKKIQSIPHLHHDEDVPVDPKFLRLEQDVLMNICGDKHVYVYKTNDFWLQIKSAGMIIKCSEYLLTLVRRSNPEQLLKYNAPGPLVVGDVLIHPTAKIDSSAKLGPNVSIGANVKIGAGVRIRDSILLDDVLVKDHALINNSIVGWESKIGEWSRLEGSPDYENPEVKVGCGMTILGTGVKVAPEIIIRSSIVLPHKDLDRNYSNQILL